MTEDFASLTDANVQDLKRVNIALGYAPTRLDNFRNSAISDAWLAKLQSAFDKVRSSGLKVVLRFAYNNPSDPLSSTADAPLNIVKQHVAQLTPILAKNADVIAILQSGFIGQWGEAHDSTNGLDTPDNKIAVRDALLAALPVNRMLQWRYPPDLIAWAPALPTEAVAFTNALAARIGVHNDCFLSSPTDVGTFSDVPSEAATQRAYTKASAAIAPYGGETCDAQAAQIRSSCPDILAEGRDYHLNYLNRDYFINFHKRWQLEGCFDEVERSMGYRFIIVSSRAPASGTTAKSSAFSVTIKNSGWSRLFNPRPLILTLTHRATAAAYSAEASSDLRRLNPNSSVDFNFMINLPTNAPLGIYDLSLSAPDAADSIKNDPRYSIRFANADDIGNRQTWDVVAARLKLGQTFELKAP